MLISNAAQDQLSQDDFEAIRDFIHEKSGIWFPDNKKYIIENRLFKRMEELGLDCCRDYLYRAKYDTSMKEFDTLMDLITTNETSFFRNLPQLDTFSEDVLPRILGQISKNRYKRLKIWSAGCSSGEEPYTLAILLRENLADIQNWNIEIIANDISQSALYSARKGVYSQSSLRNTDQKIILKYFQLENDQYRIKDEVRRLVKFNHLNLNDRRQVSLIKDCDVIFCRNVMIYFSKDAKKNLVKQFYRCLKPDGYLFIGHSETLHGISRSFELEYLKNALVYRRATASIGKSTAENNDIQAVHAKTMDTLAKIKVLLNKQQTKV